MPAARKPKPSTTAAAPDKSPAPAVTSAAHPLDVDRSTARDALAPAPKPLFHQITDLFARGLTSDATDIAGLLAIDEEKLIPESKQLAEYRRMCREGNPFPLIGMQWPEFVIPPDHPDAPFFRENLKLAADANVTDVIKAAIFHPQTPLLRIDWWQHIVIAGFFDSVIGELYIAGGTGLGKGASVSMAVNLWFDAFAECRVHLTGRDREHARRNIFGETVKWYGRMKHPNHGTATAEAISHTKRHYVALLNPDVSSSTAGEAFSGAHGENTLYTYDECTALPKSFVENARRNAKTIAAIANPRGLGWFKDGFKALPANQRIGVVPGDLRMRLCVMVGGEDAINVRYQRLKYPVAPKGGIEVRSVEAGA